MGFGFTAFGASGRQYLYYTMPPDDISAMAVFAGNYLFAREDLHGPKIIYAGEAESVYAAIVNTPLWNEARAKYGANVIYWHKERDSKKRREEHGDIVEQERPPMNPEDKEAEDQE